MLTVTFLSSRPTISFPFGSGIIMATMSSTPVAEKARGGAGVRAGNQSEMSA
jgi:hypothetical protein